MSTTLTDIRANAWTGSQIWPEPNYYIHSHMVNIGRANGGLELNENDLSKTFGSFKSKALLAVKRQYRTLFRKTLI